MLNKHAPHEQTVPTTRGLGGIATAGLAAIALLMAAAVPASATQPSTEPSAGTTQAPANTPAPTDGTAAETKSPDATTEQSTASAGDSDNAIIGLPVVTSDGQRIGDVEKVVAADDGSMKEVLVKTGGFLGFGAKRVAIPVDKIAQQGKTLRLAMTADEVSALPEVPAQEG